MPASRRVLATCLVLVFAVMAAGDVCLGWSADPEARAACCERMANRCATLSADDCCADKEQRDARELPPAPAQPARDLTAGPLASPILLFAHPGTGLPVSSSRPRTHLLHAVFLI